MSRKRSGFTLIEMLTVVAMMAIIVAVSVPRVRSVRDRSNLRAARDEVATGLAVARSAAVQKGTTATFIVRHDTVRVALANGLGQSIMPARPLDVLYGVQVRPDVADTAITFDSRGFVPDRSQKVKYLLNLGTLKDSVCVSRLGIVTKTGCVKGAI
jgi:prepilin-type N-terminal cleavage/methylation domain-containing protein